MRRGGIGLVLLVAAEAWCAIPAQAGEVRWLVIGATGKTLAPIMARQTALGKHWPGTNVVRSTDCTNFRPGLYLLVVGSFEQRAEAEQPLARIRKTVADAYVRSCKIARNSLLFLGIPLLDPSIQAVPTTAVNWSDADRITEVRPVKAGVVLIKRVYDASDQGWREGRKQDLYFFRQKGEQPVLLRRDCWDTGEIVSFDNLLAFQCAAELAAETYLHKTIAIDLLSMHLIVEEPSCRDPQFTADGLSCEKEAVDANGRLHLTRKMLPLASGS